MLFIHPERWNQGTLMRLSLSITSSRKLSFFLLCSHSRSPSSVFPQCSLCYIDLSSTPPPISEPWGGQVTGCHHQLPLTCDSCWVQPEESQAGQGSECLCTLLYSAVVCKCQVPVPKASPPAQGTFSHGCCSHLILVTAQVSGGM